MTAGSLLHASVGAYRLVDFLGAGGMGEVYRGIDTGLGRVVAIKVLSTNGPAGTLLERFKNEAQIQATLQHPNVVGLYDFLELGGRPCIVMEYVDGETIDSRIRREGSLRVAEALTLFESIVGAVGYLHGRGIVHRDLKTGNIKISEAGRVKLLDFGLAQNAGTPRLTATGMVVGTLEYMAPEQLALQPADQRTDIWALGVVLYEMVTGRLPFESNSVGDLLRRIAQAEYFPASTLNPRVPRAVDTLIAGCLKQNPDDRTPTTDRLIGQVRPLTARLRRDSIPAGPIKTVWPSKWAQWVAGFHRLIEIPQIRLAAVVLGAFGILATVGVAITRRHDPVIPARVTPRPKPATLGQCGLAGPSTTADRVREVTIDVPGGWANIRCGDSALGRTPIVIRAEIGRTVRITLSRDGFVDQTVEFAATSNTRAFQFPMQPVNRQEDQPIKGSLLASFAWLPLPLFGRRKKPVSSGASGVKSTNAEGVAVGGFGRIAVSVLSDLGCVRETNEDAVGSCAPVNPLEREQAGILLVVADGMGGHSAGEVASRIAVETVIENYSIDNADPAAALSRAVRLANHKIHQAAKTDRARTGMGTTCTAVVIRQGLAYCGHVGDSRLYLVRDGTALQMTEDHSAVYDLVKRGVIERDAARIHPDRNVIVRALGPRPEIEVAGWSRPLAVRHGDRFVVSSDGLHDLVTDAEIAEITFAGSPEVACRQLVEIARERGGHDNISLGILAISSDAPTVETALAAATEATAP